MDGDGLRKVTAKAVVHLMSFAQITCNVSRYDEQYSGFLDNHKICTYYYNFWCATF